MFQDGNGVRKAEGGMRAIAH